MKTLFILAIFFASITSFSQTVESTANKFLSSLNKNQKSKALYAFDDNERLNWHYIPRSRKGVALHDLDVMQREAAFALLKASLSEQGYKKATGIIDLERVLREVEGRGPDDTYRDPLNYYLTIFGTPSPAGIWGWRLEGHHISLNFSSLTGNIDSATPSFFGANPAVVPQGADKGKQVLKLETELGFLMINTLSAEQKKTAIISDNAPAEIITGNDRHGRELEPRGIPYSSLNEEQKKIFTQLLDVYIKNYAFGFSAKLKDKIQKAGIEKLHFAWAGSLIPGTGHYYRIQGPILLIEYDNTQNSANHVHTVVRDLTNDFAEDILREHYKKEHGK